MKEQFIDYQIDGKSFKGFVVLPESNDLKPAVIIAHTWKGQDEFVRDKARELAKLGYIGFAADLYGDGQEAFTDEEAGKLMYPLVTDRALLQERIGKAFDTVANLPSVDKDNIGAIGFCFGGVTVLELLRSGRPVKGVVCFHAGLTAIPLDKVKQKPISTNIQGSILILHGYDDPLVSPESLLSLEKELTEANVDWQLTIYGHTTHAFTNPQANTPEKGLNYNPQSDKRSWLAMKNFFNEIFND